MTTDKQAQRTPGPRSVNDLIEINDPAACNILDMIDLDPSLKSNGDRIAELYAAHAPEDRAPKQYELRDECIYYVGDKTHIASVNYSTMLRRGDAMHIVRRLNAHDDLVTALQEIATRLQSASAEVDCFNVYEARDLARAAIAKAERKS